MDFIEKLFGISPDNGDGTTEILWLVVLALLLAGLLWRKRSRAVATGQPHFKCTARTRVGIDEAVLVTCSVYVADAASLVGAIVLIDGAYYAVLNAIATATPTEAGEPIMMRVRRLD